VTRKILVLLSWFQKHKITVSLIIISCITNLSLTIFNGRRICVDSGCGLYIGGLHFHDSLWHLALSNVAFQQYPFILPIFSGVNLSSYNYLLDLFIFLLKGLGIPTLVSYFKLIPVIYCFMFAGLSYKYLHRMNKSSSFINSALFFLFFGSSFSYILSLWHFGKWQSFMYSQAMQSGRALLNMQYAVSLLFFLASLIILQEKKLNAAQTVLLGLFLFITTGLKFYGGATLVVILAIYSLVLFIKTKKLKILLFQSCIYVFGFFGAVILFYTSSSSGKGGLPFAFSPFAIVHSLIEERDMFYIPNLVLARYTLLSSPKLFSPRLLSIELFTTAIFLMYNMGTRVIGVVDIFIKLIRRKLTGHELSLLGGILFSALATLLFVQKGDWWNVIQFFGYSLFLLNVFAGSALANLFVSKKMAPMMLGILLIFLTLPTNIEQLSFAREKYVSFTDSEVAALTILKEKPYGTVLQLPVSEYAYIPAFSNKPLYFGDKGVLNILGVDYKPRGEEVKKPTEIDFEKKDIRYIYINKSKFDFSGDIFLGKGFKKLFENTDISLFQKE